MNRPPTNTSQLKQLRKEWGISQMQLASELRININSLINWERGVAHPNLENQTKLNEYFNCEVKI